MNVFVLCTGRSGSTTFHRACRHITNFTAAHEGRTSELGADRFAYPDDHIEVDNRLTWLLGRLDRAFGERAFYVHLRRDDRLTARSFDRRWSGRYSIIRAYAEGILRRRDRTAAICLDYVDTVNANIETFLRDKPNSMTIRLEDARNGFAEFWKRIGADGDLEGALGEFEVMHNPSKGRVARVYRRLAWALRSGFRPRR